MLTNLLRAAADYEKLPGLFENMHTMLQVWISTYDDYARENHPLAEMAASWLERLHATRSLLDRISAASNSSGSEA